MCRRWQLCSPAASSSWQARSSPIIRPSACRCAAPAEPFRARRSGVLGSRSVVRECRVAGLLDARTVLRERFGHAEFRPVQAEVVGAVVEGRDILAVLPTGSGKSLLYQLPALPVPSLTLVVSPLVSLMRDQVHHLVALGTPAATLHSAAEPHETAEVHGRLRSGSLKLLYVAPERLDQPAMI